MITEQKWKIRKQQKTYPNHEGTWLLTQRVQQFRDAIKNQQVAVFVAHFLYQALFITFLVLGILNGEKYFATSGKEQTEYQSWYTYIIAAIALFIYYNYLIFLKTYELHYRINHLYNSLHYSEKHYKTMVKLDWILSFLPISSTLYRNLVLFKYLVPKYKYKNSLDNTASINYLITLTSNSKLSKLSKDSFVFSVQELAIASVLLSLFLIITTLTKFTGLSRVGLSFEYVFYIVFALFFSTFKACVLGLIADFASLLFTGAIWSWFWMYAIIPICVVIISKLFIWMYKANTKWAALTTVIIMSLVFLALLVTVSYGAYLQDYKPDSSHIKNIIGIDKMNGNYKGWRISRTFGFSTISGWIVWIMVWLAGIFTIIMISLLVIILTNYTNEKDLNSTPTLLFIKKVLISFGLVVSVIVLMRWIYGPYVYIQYMNYFMGKSYLASEKYIYFMIPIALRSLISIPVYILFLVTIYSTIDFFKERVIKQKKRVSY
ncbi:hypothetical protein [Mycoplasma seminis]|uniref:ABC transporter permease n=1 Tax=Mycoplasma seminis TaxID=512749 RepID=A0ABY9HDW1_9MOLU|nr:hypothetical protein [Mycoplasma seminis]WLP85863.1 hypothetical protein Q8852_01810 [Mycoplasma seminis]